MFLRRRGCKSLIEPRYRGLLYIMKRSPRNKIYVLLVRKRDRLWGHTISSGKPTLSLTQAAPYNRSNLHRLESYKREYSLTHPDADVFISRVHSKKCPVTLKYAGCVLRHEFTTREAALS